MALRNPNLKSNFYSAVSCVLIAFYTYGIYYVSKQTKSFSFEQCWLFDKVNQHRIGQHILTMLFRFFSLHYKIGEAHVLTRPRTIQSMSLYRTLCRYSDFNTRTISCLPNVRHIITCSLDFICNLFWYVLFDHWYFILWIFDGFPRIHFNYKIAIDSLNRNRDEKKART